MAFDGALREIQPVSGPTTARTVELTDATEVEDLVGVAGINADAVVSNADPLMAIGSFRLDRDLAFALRLVVEEERVREDRVQRLTHLLRIDIHHRQIVGDRHL